MAAILEIPEVRQRLSRLSVAEYHQLGEYNQNGRRTELIRGLVIEKMSKSPPHSTLGSRLYKMISAHVSEEYLVRKEEPLTLSDSEPEPDISVIHGSENDFKSAHPSKAELVIEVAVSSATLDRENAFLYAEAGVKEYWIVLGSKRQVEVYRSPQDGRFQEKQIIGPDAILECASLPSVRIPLADLFA